MNRRPTGSDFDGWTHDDTSETLLSSFIVALEGVSRIFPHSFAYILPVSHCKAHQLMVIEARKVPFKSSVVVLTTESCFFSRFLGSIQHPTRSRQLQDVRKYRTSTNASATAAMSGGTTTTTKRLTTTSVRTSSHEEDDLESLDIGVESEVEEPSAFSDDLFLKSMSVGMQTMLVRINRTAPQGFFASRDRNLAVKENQDRHAVPRGPIPLPKSSRDIEVEKIKAASKQKQVALEIDPEYQKVVPEAYVNQLMPLTGQYTASEPGIVETEALMREHGPLFPAQLDLETQAANLEICRSMSSKDNVTSLGRGSEMGPARSLMRQWYHPLVNALRSKISHELTRTKTTQLMSAISSLRPDFLAAITLHAAIGHTLSHSEGAQFSQLATAIAETVQAQINYDLLKQHNPKFLESRYGPKAVYSQQTIQKLSKRMLQTPDAPEMSDAALRSKTTVASQALNANKPQNSSDGFSSMDLQDSGTSITSSDMTMHDLDTVMKRLEATDAASDTHLSAAARNSGSFSRHNGSSLKNGGKKYLTPQELGAPHAKLWSKQLKQEVGKFLLSTLAEVATFTHVTENGVTHEKQAFEVETPKSTASDVMTIRTIRLADAILENISYEHVLQEANHIRHYPMLIPPRKWKGPEDGGYFLYPASVLRYYNYEQQMRPLYENHDQLSLLYEALSALGETPWRVNKDVYNVIKQAWAEGGAVADIPSRSDLPLPVPGPEGKTPQWYKQLQRIQTENYNKNSLRCDLLLKLLVAEKFSEDVMYFPHNMDFRGRVYPIPPHLNHMGSDLCRGLLTFSEGKPLGSRGLYWLKIQLANLYGQDKIPFEQRVAWAEEHLPEVEDSATKPLRGRRWWLKAEDPWQCLACCFELQRALKHPEGPENYVSTLPIHQDGTCNGLQHYAALGGDEQGAKSVNLLPADRPQDVYADVAALVQARIAQDAANGVEIAIMLKGQVNRRIIKQTVMTSVYGVTFIGARMQIANALKDRGVLAEEARYHASIYLARATFDSIGEMFTGARSIMDWFATCASLVAKRNRLVSWTTPLGLPVAQPYKKLSKKNVLKTAFQTITLENESSGPVNSLRQRSAFPPNFVHSLDSSHMLLTALACKRKGIMFASVHDSYWSHACNVDHMNVELRDAFVELHRRPLLQRLYDQFAKDNPDINFPPVPERGSFDLDLVKQSPYFFN